jgi:hypothetical protein
MHISLSTDLAALIAKAYTTGTETSIRELAELLDLTDCDTLTAAASVVELVDRLELELLPGPAQAEFGSSRVLRQFASTTDGTAHARHLMATGEGPSLEFKSSLLCSMYHWNHDGSLIELPSLTGEVLRTICAFLNSDGGELLVGVDDEGATCGGVQRDLELKNWSLDKWQRHFGSLVSGRFQEGGLIPPYLRIQMLEIDSIPVLYVGVMPRVRRSFVQREKGGAYEFFVRTGPRTDSLDLPSFYVHLAARGTLALTSL